MSFFGFDPALPRDRGHAANAPGFGQAPDAFAGLSGGALEDDEPLDFDDTYDGLGNQLDETGDDFNDETFGGGPAIGKDFDFAGQTHQISNTIHEEQILFHMRNPPSQQKKSAPPPASKPTARSGYERYKDPEYIPQLEANANIWGIQPKVSARHVEPPPQHTQHYVQQPQSQPQAAAPLARKMMSLDEVEAAMRNNTASRSSPAPSVQPIPVQPPQGLPHLQQHAQQFQHHAPHSQAPQYPGGPAHFAPQILQRPQQHHPQQQQQHGPLPAAPRHQQQVHAELPGQPAHLQPSHPPTILQRPSSQQNRHASPQPGPHGGPHGGPPSQPRQILQNPNRLAGHGQPVVGPAGSGPRSLPGHNRGPSFPGMVITHPEQLLQLSETERAAFLEEDAKRAKRNHKIALLSKDNGLMTPQDKNFITRIQLQQLMSATGNLEEAGSEAALAEDFYYQVFSQIRGAPRQNPNQPTSQFAQTYLFQTNSRFGAGRRHGRGGDNHMQRMEQQVQRAVEAAKAKPKGRQLVIEGSLGKIAFSNAKTPRPLLNIKRTETGDKHLKHLKPSIADRKQILRSIEAVYMTLMHMDDHERGLPPPVNETSDPEAIQKHNEWRSKIEELHTRLWQDIKIMEPINPQSLVPHPFISILSHAKGKKAIPRIFRHIDEKERMAVVTMIVVHLDSLSAVAHAIATPDEPLSAASREEVELFINVVMPSLFAHISESPLNIVIGLLGLILERTNLHVAARSKIGMSLLTILISRAELLKQSNPDMNQQDWEQWTVLYNKLFDTVEPVLPLLFPGTVNDTDDMYVWQFLAAMGVGASPEQQQRLVIGVKDRVMETVTVSKALPAEMAGARLANVNLFMRAIGLDVELLG